MRQLFKGLGLFIATACLVWVGVLWHWQSTRRDMSTEDIVLYLVLLPVALFVLVLLARWALGAATARADRRAAAALAAPVPAAAEAPAPSVAEEARHATCRLLAAPLACLAGTSARELLQAAREGQPRPGLDIQLRRADGLPAITARVPAADEALLDLEEALAPTLAALRQQRPEFATREPAVRLLRALALLQPVLTEAVGALAPWAGRLGGAAAPPVGAAPGDGPAGADTQAQVAAHGARRQAPLQPEPASVRVLVAWPEGLDDFHRELARRWLADTLRTLGEPCVAPERWRLHQPAGGGPELLLEADRVLHEQRRQGRQDLLLLAACHSDLDEAQVLRLDDAQALFGAATPRGRVPGEVAAVLLLADAGWPALDAAATDAPPPWLHRPAVAQRGKPVDAAGRTSSDVAVQVLQHALAAARLPAAEAASLTTDADQHSARGPELFGATLAELPHLDAAEDLFLAGPVSGHLGPCGALVAVAMAVQRVADTAKPCLALSVGDAVWRAALAVCPALPPASTPLPPPKSPA